MEKTYIFCNKFVFIAENSAQAILHQVKIPVTILFILISTAIFAQVPTVGLIAWYPLNGQANDASGNSNNGTLMGGINATPDRFGNSCGALSFNGIDAFIEVPTSSSLESPVKAITIAAWFRLDRNPAAPGTKFLTLLCKGDNSDQGNSMPQYRFQLLQNQKQNTSTISLSTAFNRIDKNFKSHAIDFDTWNFCAVTFDGSSVKLYLNGAQVWDTVYSTSFVANKLPLNIGRDVPGKTDYYLGGLDDIRIYNRALSVFEIGALYNDKTGSNFQDDMHLSSMTNIEMKTDAGVCYATVNFPKPVVTTGCGKSELKQVAGLPYGSHFPVGRSSVTFLATNTGGRKETSTFDIIIADKIPPVINCPSDIKVKCPFGAKGIEVDYDAPTAADNCPGVQVSLVSGLASGSQFPVGESTVRYKATDAAGNSAECSFKVIVEKEAATTWTLSCPDDIVMSNTTGKCGAIVTYYAPKIPGYGQDEIPINQMLGSPSGKFFPIGSTINSFKASDNAGSTQTCSFTVKVVDNENPTIQCPADTTITLKEGETSTRYSYAQPTASDNCHVKSLRQVDGLPSGSYFAIGANKITYNAEDDAGNSVLRSFTITVKGAARTAQPVVYMEKAVPTRLSKATTGFDDSIDYQHIIKPTAAPGCTYTIFIFDNEDEDGDSVSIIFNDKVIVDKQMIHVISNYSYTLAIKRVLELDPGKPNILVSKAWNVGSSPPNTCEVDIYQGDLTNNMIDANKENLVKRLILNAVPGVAAGITMQCKE